MSDKNPGMPDGITISKDTEAEAIINLAQSNKELNSALKYIGIDINRFIKQQKKKEKEQNQDKKDIFKGFEKTKDSIKEQANSFKEATIEAVTSPLKAFTSPLKSLLGVDLPNIFENLWSDIKANGKKNPSESDVLKTGKEGTNALFIANTMKKLWGDKVKIEDEEKLRGLLSLLGAGGGAGLAGLIAKALPVIGKVVGIGMIIGSLVWAIIDGITGYFKSDEWGASKVSSVIGGFFAGTGEGLKGAFANAGKWALMGAGIGLVGGPVGVIAGGLIGAAIGGVLGFFGGKKLAQGLDNVGKFLYKTFIKGFIEVWKDKKKSPLQKILGILGVVISGLFKTLISSIKSAPSFLKDYILGGIKGIVTRVFDWLKEKTKNIPIIGEIVSAISTGLGAIFNFWDAVLEEVDKLFTDPVAYVKELWEGITGAVSAFFSSIMDMLKEVPEILFGGEGDKEISVNRAKAYYEEAVKTGRKQEVLKAAGLSEAQFLKKLENKSEADAIINWFRAKGIKPIDVDDAIITKTGQVIKTSPQDNLIATKSNPFEMMQGGNKEMISVLYKILTALERIKPTGNMTVINNKPLIDMNDLKGFI